MIFLAAVMAPASMAIAGRAAGLMPGTIFPVHSRLSLDVLVFSFFIEIGKCLLDFLVRN